jgi:deoxyadenosine/deoxycytidine kinase/8-oxo-dGTP pyrophosphatase MutT (NUDIX family)
VINKNKFEQCEALFSAVGCVCIHQNEILLLRRNKDKSYPNQWGIPTGKINTNESEISSMIRELYEETHIILSAKRFVYVDTFCITTENLSFKYVLYYSEFEELPDVIINLNEHTDYRWVHFETLNNFELVPDAKETILFAIEQKNRKRHRQLNLFTGEPEVDESAIRNFKLSDFYNFNKHLNISRKWVISFGLPCSGKTTTLMELHRRCPNSHLVSNNNQILIRGRRLNKYLSEATKNKRFLYYFYFQMELLPEKFKQTIDSEELSFIDETIYSTLAYSTSLYLLGWITEDEFEIFLSNYSVYVNFMPLPSKILYFKCSPETLLKRILRRGRKIEQLYTTRYLNMLNVSFEKVAEELRNMDHNIITVDTEHQTTEEIVDEIQQGIFE